MQINTNRIINAFSICPGTIAQRLNTNWACKFEAMTEGNNLGTGRKRVITVFVVRIF